MSLEQWRINIYSICKINQSVGAISISDSLLDIFFHVKDSTFFLEFHENINLKIPKWNVRIFFFKEKKYIVRIWYTRGFVIQMLCKPSATKPCSVKPRWPSSRGRTLLHYLSFENTVHLSTYQCCYRRSKFFFCILRFWSMIHHYDVAYFPGGDSPLVISQKYDILVGSSHLVNAKAPFMFYWSCFYFFFHARLQLQLQLQLLHIYHIYEI